jgi:hypothetical protein
MPWVLIGLQIVAPALETVGRIVVAVVTAAAMPTILGMIALHHVLSDAEGASISNSPRPSGY